MADSCESLSPIPIAHPGIKKTLKEPNLVGGFKFQISFPHLMMIDKHFLGQLNSNNTVTALVFPKVESS